MVLPRFQSVCLDLPNWGRGGGDKRVGRETRTPPAPENTRREREGRVLLLPLQHLHCDHSWTRVHDAAAAPLHVCTRVNQTICMRRLRVHLLLCKAARGRDEHPLDCSAEKHCGYLPPTRQPPSAPAKHNQRRIIPIRMTTLFLQSNASKQPLENC